MKLDKRTREAIRKMASEGGKKAAANMTPEQRKARAVKASQMAAEKRKEKAK